MIQDHVSQGALLHNLDLVYHKLGHFISSLLTVTLVRLGLITSCRGVDLVQYSD